MASQKTVFRFVTPQAAAQQIRQDFWIRPCLAMRKRRSVITHESNIKGLSRLRHRQRFEFHALARELAPDHDSRQSSPG